MLLDEICAHKREEVCRRKAETPFALIEQCVAQSPLPRDFGAALDQPGISLIAEIKRASPSKGTLLTNLDPAEWARIYERGGAHALSVLTDERYFRGSLADLTAAHTATRLPCLRKEFVIDEYQIYEARAAQADAVLLIVRILSDEQLHDYLDVCHALHLAALVETHDAYEIERAVRTGSRILGINNRDLDTLEVNVSRTLELRKLVPDGRILVSESGIHTRDHVKMLEDGGIDAILVGEALVTSRNVADKVRELLGRDES